MIRKTLVLILFLFPLIASGRGTYQTPQEFLDQVFQDEKPLTKVIWVGKDLRDRIESVLQHPLSTARIR